MGTCGRSVIAMAFFCCTKETIIPVDSSGVRWLDPNADCERAIAYWAELGHVLRQGTWLQAHGHGYRYAGLVRCERVLSCSAVWRFSEECWELAAVTTLESHRRRGYAKQTASFVTAHILEEGRSASCSTNDDNMAMIATAESVGYRRIPADQVWWTVPTLPEF